MNARKSSLLAFCLLLGLPGCTQGTVVVPTACTVSAAPSCVSGFVGYACAAGARPDADGQIIEGIPHGLLCTDEGAISGDPREGFCCTEAPTTCVFNPASACSAPYNGYQCLGSDRPDAFDPTLFCGEGIGEGNFIDYCCGATPLPAGCAQAASAACPQTLDGWTCTDSTVPTEAELGSNQSRADFTLLLCSVPAVTTTSTATLSKYCCYTPTDTRVGASCVQDTTVPGCPSGNFGFACTGADTPTDDYPRMTCSGGGTPGRSTQGYAATLYCCTFQ
jgi:hypothetical protein